MEKAFEEAGFDKAAIAAGRSDKAATGFALSKKA